jgi:hypothetical protein
VWLCLSGRSVTDKILAILFPITAFVASGFEHSIANMYFIPMGLLLRGEPEVLAAAGKVAADLVNLNFAGFLANLLSVTTGNIFGGGFMVAAVYWFIYRRPHGQRHGGRRLFELFISPTAQSHPELQPDATQAPSSDQVRVAAAGEARSVGGNGSGGLRRG